MKKIKDVLKDELKLWEIIIFDDPFGAIPVAIIIVAAIIFFIYLIETFVI